MLETRKSFCRFCHASCAIEVEVEVRADAEGGDRILSVRGDRSDPVFGGYTCIKGRQLPEQHQHPDRLFESLRLDRETGERTPIPSSTALDEIAARLETVVADHGARAVALYGGTAAFQCATSLPVARAWLKGLGSPSFYSSITIDQPAKVIAPARIGFWEAGVHDFSTADVVMMIGNNPLISSYAPPGAAPGFSPWAALREGQRRGVKVICIDPRASELARKADLHLQPLPGEDAPLLAGMLRVILSERLHDRDFCERWVDPEDLARLEVALEPFTPERSAARAGVSPAELIAAARLFAAGPRGAASTGTGPSMAPWSSLTEHLVQTLNVVCGRFHREGEQIGNPGVLSPARPMRAQVVPPEALQGVFRRGGPSRIRGLQPLLGELPTAALPEEILTPGEGQVRALVNVGGNPVVAWPDQLRVLEALDALDLHVSLDVVLSATARRSDYAIACRLSLERPDVPTTIDPWFEVPYSHYTPAVVEPRFDVLAEWEFFWELSHRMRTPIRLPGGELSLDQKPSADDVLDGLYANARIPLDQLRRHEGGHVFDEVDVVVEPAAEDAQGRFRVAPDDALAELAAMGRQRCSLQILPGYDEAVHTHRLISRRLRHVVNSTGQQLSALRDQSTTNPAYMNPEDMSSLGLEAGDLVEIRSPRSAIQGVAEPAPDLRPGVVSMAHAWGDGPDRDGCVREIGATTGRLIDATEGVDAFTGIPVQSAIPVSVRRIPGL